MVRKSDVAIVVVWLLMAVGSSAAQQNATDRMISRFQERAARFANDYANFDNLGAAYIQKGRETQDFSYYELARKALNKSFDLASEDMTAAAPLTHLAALSMAEHRFTDAATYAERALSFGSGDLAPYALLGDAYTDLGDYDKAYMAYSRLKSPGQPRERQDGLTYMYDSRISYFKFLFGDVPTATQLMRDAIQLAIEMRMPAENIAWSEFQLGDELFKSGDIKGAEASFQRSLASYPNFYRALAGLAQVRASQGRYQEAAEFYRRATAVVPLPEYATALGDVYLKLGLNAEAKKQFNLVEFIANVNPLNKHAFNRELASYYADHNIKLKDALDLAGEELKVRADVYTMDVYAWVLFKHGEFKQAAVAITQAMRLHTADPLFFFHAGMIYNQLGNREEAKKYLHHALELNPHFHVMYADVAAQTLTALEKQSTVASGRETGNVHP